MPYTVQSTNAANSKFADWTKDTDLLDQLKKMVVFLQSTPRENDQDRVKHLKAKGIYCRYEYRRLKHGKRVFYQVVDEEETVIIRMADDHVNKNGPYPDLTLPVAHKALPACLVPTPENTDA